MTYTKIKYMYVNTHNDLIHMLAIVSKTRNDLVYMLAIGSKC